MRLQFHNFSPRMSKEKNEDPDAHIPRRYPCGIRFKKPCHKKVNNGKERAEKFVSSYVPYNFISVVGEVGDFALLPLLTKDDIWSMGPRWRPSFNPALQLAMALKRNLM